MRTASDRESAAGSGAWLQLAQVLAQTAAAVLAALVAHVQSLPETCPEAFDENGNLRENWVALVFAAEELARLAAT